MVIRSHGISIISFGLTDGGNEWERIGLNSFDGQWTNGDVLVVVS